MRRAIPIIIFIVIAALAGLAKLERSNPGVIKDTLNSSESRKSDSSRNGGVDTDRIDRIVEDAFRPSMDAKRDGCRPILTVEEIPLGAVWTDETAQIFVDSVSEDEEYKTSLRSKPQTEFISADPELTQTYLTRATADDGQVLILTDRDSEEGEMFSRLIFSSEEFDNSQIATCFTPQDKISVPESTPPQSPANAKSVVTIVSLDAFFPFLFKIDSELYKKDDVVCERISEMTLLGPRDYRAEFYNDPTIKSLTSTIMRVLSEDELNNPVTCYSYRETRTGITEYSYAENGHKYEGADYVGKIAGFELKPANADSLILGLRPPESAD